jgi:predicted RNase H-like nuclease (RuvC/YqgF family)
VKALEQENEKLRGGLKKKSAENDMLRQALDVFKSGDDEDMNDNQTGSRRSSNATLRQLLDIMTKNNEVRGSSMKEENEDSTS